MTQATSRSNTGQYSRRMQETCDGTEPGTVNELEISPGKCIGLVAAGFGVRSFCCWCGYDTTHDDDDDGNGLRAPQRTRRVRLDTR